MVDVSFRHPTEEDHRVLEPVLRDWCGGSRTLAESAQRLWFRHFASTSWIAQSPDGRIAGFVVGFVSPDRPSEAVVVVAATNPNVRRKGIGRALFARFEETAAALGARRVIAAVPPDERVAVDFLRALGFVTEGGEPTRRLFGVDAVVDYEGHGRDRAVFVREIPTGG